MREMKDSGMPWIGKIPKDWKTDKFKYHLKRSEPRNPGNQVVLSLYRDYGIIPKDSRDDNHNVTSEDTSNYKYVQIGDFVVNKMKAWQGSVAVSNYEGIVSPAYYVYKFSDHQIYKKYLHYLLRACYKDEFMRLSGGLRVGQWDLSADGLGNTYILIPPYDEQVKIADYLDSKKERIDSIREGVEAEIEALKQYKQSVITEAVTKGLDKDVEMKDSGIPWIGKIPKDWEIKRLKYACNKISDGTHFSPITVDNGYPYLTAKDIQGLTIDFEKAQKVSDDDFFKLKKSGCCPQKGDVLIVKDGATTGRTGMMLKQIECVLLSSVAMMHVNNFMNNFFLWYFLQSKSMQKQIESSMAGSAITRITLAKLSNFVLTCPSLKEQQRIADFLDAKCARIDSIIQKKQELLTNLDTYKKSLIYEYVTGKKEVPAV